ncbi:MAG: RidA family protein [Phycisphaerae bacterium]|nr:RidA family protein [Phycisphaerae bacterium]MDW8260978.1 RidA family protein [Phycisphaerales bacterium]
MNQIPMEVSERHGRLCASSGSSWEPVMGYSRAVRSGNQIAVTGTVGINPDGTYPPALAAQTRRSLQIILAALKALGAGPEHVIRTRIYCTDITRWQEIAQEHRAVFGQIRPATTLLQVPRLIDEQAMIEIEADAVM